VHPYLGPDACDFRGGIGKRARYGSLFLLAALPAACLSCADGVRLRCAAPAGASLLLEARRRRGFFGGNPGYGGGLDTRSPLDLPGIVSPLRLLPDTRRSYSRPEPPFNDVDIVGRLPAPVHPRTAAIVAHAQASRIMIAATLSSSTTFRSCSDSCRVSAAPAGPQCAMASLRDNRCAVD